MAKAQKDKVNLSNISQAHGALPDQKSIAQILGYKAPYTEGSLNEYVAKIDAMTDSDLHEHAVEVGIVPGSNVVLLKDKLQRQFLSEQNKFAYKTNPVNISKKNQEAIRAFMKDAI